MTDPTDIEALADRLESWIDDGVARGWPDVQDDLRTAARILRAVAATPGPLAEAVDWIQDGVGPLPQQWMDWIEVTMADAVGGGDGARQ